MKQITTVKNQTIFDLALQEYGNVEAAFQILADNPHLAGLNDLPDGYSLTEEADFDLSYPIKTNTMIFIQESLEIANTVIANELDTVIS